MIPLTLRLTNFLSYREMAEALDLSRIHVACLSGANGNGKSALLDAITWALWGKARGSEGGQEQERLIRDGADECRVELTFELSGQTYRVVRGRSRKGKADLHLQVAEGDGWTDMTGESVTSTQAAISRLLRMEYETFVASAYILQGRADEFLRRNAAARKDTLAEILGLEVYERLAERAKAYKKEHETFADAHRSDAERYEAELQEIPPLEAALSDARDGAAVAREARSRAQAELDDALTRLAAARAVEAEVAAVEGRLEESRARLDVSHKEIASLEVELAAASAAADVGAETRAVAAERPGLEERDVTLSEAGARDRELADEAAALRRRIDVERERLLGDRRGAERTIADAERQLETVEDADRRLAALRATLAELATVAAERDALESGYRELLAMRERERTLRTGRDQTRAELAERATLLDAADAACPVCEQPLTAQHRKAIAGEVAARIEALRSEDAVAAEALKRIDRELAATERRGRELRKALDAREEITAKAAAVEQQITAAEQVRGRLNEARRTISEIDAILEVDADSPTEREKLASILAERAMVAYDAAAHAATRERLDASRRAERILADAAASAARIELLARQIEGSRERERELAAAFEAAIAAVAEKRALLADAAALEREAETARAGVSAAQEELIARAAAIAAVEARLQALGETREKAAASREALKEAKLLAGRFEKLAKVFGRDGIPHKIIGNAVPELRAEANRLLSALTDGRLSLEIELQRESKSRTVKETLDIAVWSGGAKRAYEMYSGGERLRIDFALRIALSRLLARRANTRLETLVIDEGFGSQDAEGRARLVEAILKVKEDFRRVLVITHIDELKDLFPVRLEVEKDPVHGSRVLVV
jgi:exonuclease SbcC